MKKYKNCRKCDNAYELTLEFFSKQPRNKDGYQSYCRHCQRDQVRQSKMKNKTTLASQDGFMSDKDHFNRAIQHYAKIFNCPQLVKHVID